MPAHQFRMFAQSSALLIEGAPIRFRRCYTIAVRALQRSVWIAYMLLAPCILAAELHVPADFASIQGALDAAQDGDSVLVAAGVYPENLRFAGKDVSLRSVSGPENTIIDARQAVGVTMGPKGELAGFTVRNASGSGGAAVQVSGQGSRIKRNIFEDNQQSGGSFGAAIGGNGASPVIEQNLFRRNSSDDQHLSGVVAFVNTSSPRIANNVFFNNASRAINMTVPAASAPEIINNTIVANRVGIHIDVRVNTSGQVYRNNLIFNNDIGVEAVFGSPAFVWENNLVFGNDANFDGMPDPSGQKGNISSHPLLSSPDTGNFSISPGSPAVDSGSPQSAPSVDFEGSPRPEDGDLANSAEVDIGAYELQPVPPAAPAGLTGLSGDGEARLSWEPSRNADRYSILRATSSGGPYTAVADAVDTSLVDTDVVNGIPYFYAITAANIFGQSEPSAEVEVIPGNKAPIATTDFVLLAEDSEIAVNVLANDSDPDGDAIRLTMVNQPANGTSFIDQQNEVVYRPAPDFHGEDEFTYAIEDHRGSSSSATVSVTVTPVNDRPIASPLFRSLGGDTMHLFSLSGGDIDGDPLSFFIVEEPRHGVILEFDNLTGQVVYQPAHGFRGLDQFSFVAADAHTNSLHTSVQLSLVAPRDSDRNGIPDYWEIRHDIKNALDDRDLDGMSNLDEYRANTDPRDHASSLRLLHVEPLIGQGVRVTWKAVAGVRYRLEYSDDYFNSFQDIPLPTEDAIAPGSEGVGVILDFLDGFHPASGLPTSSARFYRVRVAGDVP